MLNTFGTAPGQTLMRYLILADIHGNIDALDAIGESFDQVLFLGDLVDYGPAPEEAVQWIRDVTHIDRAHTPGPSPIQLPRNFPEKHALSRARRAEDERVRSCLHISYQFPQLAFSAYQHLSRVSGCVI